MRLWMHGVVVTCALHPTSAFAEDAVGTGLERQELQKTTPLRVDILQVGETIRWSGDGKLEVRTPSGTLVRTLNKNQSHTTTEVGVWQLAVTEDQAEGTNWEIRVTRNGTIQYGRLHAPAGTSSPTASTRSTPSTAASTRWSPADSTASTA